MKVLVTGGAGFIGSHLCARLLHDGHQVLCVDNLLTGSERNIEALRENPRFTFVNHDVTQPMEAEADAVFHLASPASPIGYWTYPFETIRVNTEGTWKMLELAKRSNATFLMASTSETYGDPLVHPQVEEYWGNVNPIGERSCYDEGKRLGETLTMEYRRQYGCDTRIVRIFNTYGPHSQLEDGRFIPNFITQALKGQPVTVHGTGEQTRSICYVEDMVDGLVRAMWTENTAGRVYNLGNPEEHTVLEWANTIIRLCDSQSKIAYEPKRLDDPERRRPNIDRAERELGWVPRIDPETGLKRTIEWFRLELEREASCLSVNVG